MSGGLLKALRSDSSLELSPYRHQHFPGDNEEQEKLLKESCTSYVGNLSLDTPEEQIYALFGKRGDIKRITTGLGGMKERACGFCFVAHRSRADAENAVWYQKGTRLGERIVRTGGDTALRGAGCMAVGGLGARSRVSPCRTTMLGEEAMEDEPKTSEQ